VPNEPYLIHLEKYLTKWIYCFIFFHQLKVIPDLVSEDLIDVKNSNRMFNRFIFRNWKPILFPALIEMFCYNC
jgi:hypothetical protein